MSSTSTNKQPLLVDRPLHEFAVLGPSPALTTSTNLGTIISGGCVTLVDCSNSDGAVIDSLSIIANQASTSSVLVLFLLSSASTQLGISDNNTAVVATATVLSSSIGQRTNVSLPPLTIPVPNLGGETSLTETSKKNTGLYVPAGKVLYTGLTAAITAPTPATTVNVFAQGGYF